jgi:hypothetical protein
VAPVAAWAKLPSGLDPANAGALPLVLLTGDQLAVATLGLESALGLTVGHAILSEYGGTDKLELRDQPEPHARAGEIKVRVASASINPIDWKLRSGQLKSVCPSNFRFHDDPFHALSLGSPSI